MSTRLTDHLVLTFDCYGTLIDWETGIWDALQPLLAANRRDDVTRNTALKTFSRLETAQQSATPAMRYPQVLSIVHHAIAGEFDLATNDTLDTTFGDSVPHWPAFPDSADALRSLKRRFRLVVLSNVHRAGFAASNRKLGVTFDAVYTAEDIGSYKPDPRNFDHLLEHLASNLGLAAGDLLHTAQSLHHDHVPARRAGLANAWIDRQQLSRGGSWGATAEVPEMPGFDYRFFSLAEMAAAVEAECAGFPAAAAQR